MLSLGPTTRIFLCVTPVDMRKSFDSLAGLVNDVFEQDVFCGDLFVFRNREETKMKILFWERDGFVLWYKRLGATCKGAHMNGRKRPRDALIPILT